MSLQVTRPRLDVGSYARPVAVAKEGSEFMVFFRGWETHLHVPA